MSSSVNPWSPFSKGASNHTETKGLTSMGNDLNELVVSRQDRTTLQKKIDFDVDSIDCSDANICLKVSAKAFSPSWESRDTH